MSSGYGFLFYVESLKAVGFPIDRVSGGDIYSVYKAGLSIREAVYRLHSIAEFRRKMKHNLKTPE